MDSFDILVIALSITLFIFLITAIVAAIAFTKLVNKISIATDSAKQAVENVEQMTETIKNVANGSVVAGIMNSIWQKATKQKAKK